MSTTFPDITEAWQEIRDREGEWTAEKLDDGRWEIREKTAEEIAEEAKAKDEMVTVTFETRGDLEENTDEDLIEIARFVIELAKDGRAWQQFKRAYAAKLGVPE